MKICFVCLHAYPLFNPSFVHSFGGAEIRCWTIANALSILPGNQISFVVLDHGQEMIESYDNVRVYAHSHYRDIQDWLNKTRLEVKSTLLISGKLPYISPARKGGLYKLLSPLFLWKLGCVALYHLWYVALRKLQQLRQLTFYPDLIPTGKTKVYQDIDADIYCSFGVHELSSEIAAFCKRYEKKFVLFFSSDHDFSEEYFPGSHFINQYASEGYLCYYAIKNTDLIIVQTETQQNLLKERFGEDAAVLSNPIDLSKMIEIKPYNARRGALWVGKSDQVKQPQVLLDLARHFPDYPFIMVMNLVNPDVNEAIHLQLIASKPVNVEIIEYMLFDDMEKLFSQASVFINTSRFEGFPNTFLQAGKYGVPILSLNVDPDHFIEKFNCGIVAGGSFERLVEGMSILITENDKSQVYSDHIVQYVHWYHDLDDKIQQLNRMFKELIG